MFDEKPVLSTVKYGVVKLCKSYQTLATGSYRNSQSVDYVPGDRGGHIRHEAVKRRKGKREKKCGRLDD